MRVSAFRVLERELELEVGAERFEAVFWELESAGAPTVVTPDTHLTSCRCAWFNSWRVLDQRGGLLFRTPEPGAEIEVGAWDAVAGEIVLAGVNEKSLRSDNLRLNEKARVLEFGANLEGFRHADPHPSDGTPVAGLLSLL